MPQPPDPMKGLTDVFQLAQGMSGFQQQQKAIKSQASMEAALKQSNGDFEAAAEAMKATGDMGAYDTLSQRAAQQKQQRLSAVNGALERIGQTKTVLGQGTALMEEVKANPAIWPTVRPKLVDLANQISPSLADHVPTDYDEKKLGEVVFWAGKAGQQIDATQRAAQLAAAKLQTHMDVQKSLKADEEIVGNAFSMVEDQDHWDWAFQNAKGLGVSDAVLGIVGDKFTPKAVEKAKQLLMTPEQRAKASEPKYAPGSVDAAILRYASEHSTSVEQLDQKTVDKVRATWAAATREGSNGLAPKDRADLVSAVLRTPSVWSDISPTLRGDLAPELARQGFDFKTDNLSLAEKNTIERWKQDEISRLNTAKRNLQMEQPEFDAEMRRIESSYQLQTGTGVPLSGRQLTPAGAERGNPPVDLAAVATGQPPAGAPPAAPAASAAGSPAGGKTEHVKMPDGSVMSFTAEEYEKFVKEAAKEGWTIGKK